MPKTLCPHCLHEIHGYSDLIEIYQKPDGCICDPLDWGDPDEIPPICEKFEPNTDQELFCVNCEHEKGCHR
jgi:hypothetical protein